jgi:hypothetical protein
MDERHHIWSLEGENKIDIEKNSKVISLTSSPRYNGGSEVNELQEYAEG